MNHIEPTYLRFVYDKLEKGILNSENPSSLPDGFVGIYEQEFMANMPVNERQNTLLKFGLWSLFKSAVSIETFSLVFNIDQSEARVFIDTYSNWFNSPEPGKYQLYHDRIKVFFLQKLKNDELQELNEQLISVLLTSIKTKNGDTIEKYALEHLSSHMALESMMGHEYERLHQFVNNESIWRRQIDISNGYEWSQKAIQYGIKEGARRQDEIKTLRSTVNSVKLMQQEQNSAEDILRLLNQGDYLTALRRAEKWEGERQFKLYLLMIHELTLGDCKEANFKTKVCEIILEKFRETSDNTKDFNTSNFYSPYYIYQYYIALDRLNIDAKVLLERGFIVPFSKFAYEKKTYKPEFTRLFLDKIIEVFDINHLINCISKIQNNNFIKACNYIDIYTLYNKSNSKELNYNLINKAIECVAHQNQLWGQVIVLNDVLILINTFEGSFKIKLFRNIVKKIKKLNEDQEIIFLIQSLSEFLNSNQLDEIKYIVNDLPDYILKNLHEYNEGSKDFPTRHNSYGNGGVGTKYQHKLSLAITYHNINNDANSYKRLVLRSLNVFKHISPIIDLYSNRVFKRTGNYHPLVENKQGFNKLANLFIKKNKVNKLSVIPLIDADYIVNLLIKNGRPKDALDLHLKEMGVNKKDVVSVKQSEKSNGELGFFVVTKENFKVADAETKRLAVIEKEKQAARDKKDLALIERCYIITLKGNYKHALKIILNFTKVENKISGLLKIMHLLNDTDQQKVISYLYEFSHQIKRPSIVMQIVYNPLFNILFNQNKFDEIKNIPDNINVSNNSRDFLDEIDLVHVKLNFNNIDFWIKMVLNNPAKTNILGKKFRELTSTDFNLAIRLVSLVPQKYLKKYFNRIIGYHINIFDNNKTIEINQPYNINIIRGVSEKFIENFELNKNVMPYLFRFSKYTDFLPNILIHFSKVYSFNNNVENEDKLEILSEVIDLKPLREIYSN